MFCALDFGVSLSTLFPSCGEIKLAFFKPPTVMSLLNKSAAPAATGYAGVWEIQHGAVFTLIWIKYEFIQLLWILIYMLLIYNTLHSKAAQSKAIFFILQKKHGLCWAMWEMEFFFFRTTYNEH